MSAQRRALGSLSSGFGRVGFGLAACTLVTLTTGSASAYELTGTKWILTDYPNGVPVCPKAETALDAQQNGQIPQFQKAVDDAIYAWTDTGHSTDVPGTPCSGFRVQRQTCSGSPTPNSGQPWIYWEASWGSVPGVGSSTIGVTPYSFTWDNETLEAKIIMNDRDYYWDVVGQQTDVGSITVHEMGHFAGLDHYDEYSSSKQQQCFSSQTYPSVMCSAYSGGIGRIPTADDVQGICAVYPKDGAIGSSCSNPGDCDLAVCHPSGYCSKPCTTDPDCPAGYECNTANQCERDVPPPQCAACGTLPCTDNSMCVGTSGSSFCTNTCANDAACPLGFYCAQAQGASICYPLSNGCSNSGPSVGQACGSDWTCRLGDVCLQIDNAGAKQCFEVCRENEDCPQGQVCRDTNDPSLSYCDVGACSCNATSACDSGCACDAIDCACTCNTTTACEAGCSCDPHCGATPPCACNTTATCDGGCACDPHCGSCACNAGPTCDRSCACDPDCAPLAPCDCDDTYSCNPDCPCDAECLNCSCDATYGCDSDCDCDPECDGCTSVLLVSQPGGGGGAAGLVFLSLAMLPFAAAWRRRRR